MKSTSIKLTLAVFALSIFFSSAIFADEIKYNDSWSEQGFTMSASDKAGVNIIHSVNSFKFNTMNINGEDMTVINMPGVFLPNDEGAPNLPGEGRYIAIPAGATASLNIKSMRTETYSNIEVAPSPRIPFEDDDSPLYYEKNMEIYGQDALYPASPVKLSEPSKIRGVDVVMLGITPFQYNPITKELIVLRDIDVEVVFEGGNGEFGEQRYRSRWWDPIMANAIMNFSSLPTIDYNWMLQENSELTDGCEYLIITPDGADFVAKAEEIAEFRNKQGILTDIATLTEVGGNSTYAIETYVNDAYNTWTIPPTAVLLLGDFGYSISNNVIAPIYDNYCASDNIYADVDGDHLPDMIFARITANDATQLDVMVSKFINYETNPPTNPDFYYNPITAVGWQTERWFQICGEAVGGFWKNELNKNPVRINAIYSGTPGTNWSTASNTSTVVNYFGPNGLGYIPAAPSSLGGWTGGNAYMINNTINNGSFMMLHRDHGYEQGWGEPAYSNASINGLTNEDLIFVMSINCLTGKYNWSGECFTEKFHRHTSGGQNAGALGLTAASETSYSFVNDTYVWGSIDNMWPNFMPLYGTEFPTNFAMPAFGNASGKYFLQQSSWPYNTSNKRVTYHLFHHHGGAFLTLYTEEPQDLTIVHDGIIPYGSNTFNITADMGSMISLYRNGEILATATGTGAVQSIAIPSLPLMANVTLTVTKQNYFRHEELVPVENVMTANFEADTTTTCAEGAINYTDLSQGDPTSWLWTFEGGDPVSSSEQNPQNIQYNTDGVYDVTLEVSDGSSTDIYTMDDYITVMVNNEVSIAVTASFEEICEGEEVTFNATINNGGTTPAFQWKLNGVDVGDGTDVYVNNSLADTDIVACEATSSLECTLVNPVMSNEIIMTVNAILTAGISIETISTEVCVGDEVIFTAIPENGGDEPVYQWKLNGNDVGVNSAEYITSDLADADVVSCEITSNAACITGNPAMSNALDMLVKASPAELNMPAGPNEIDVYETPSSTFTTNDDPNSSDYSWTVTPDNAWADLSVDMFNLTVTWADDFTGQAFINVSGTNDCGNGPVSGDYEVSVQNTFSINENDLNIGVSVFPNPNNGSFTIQLSSEENESVKMQIRSIVGEVIFSEENLSVKGEFIQIVDLSNYAEGIYLLVLENNNNVLTEKIVVQK
ncbi:MAG: C25 family cysteine peptidase [Bacteroidota bacterium]